MEVRKEGDIALSEDGQELLQSGSELSAEDIKRLQEQLYQIGAMQQRKTSGGNKFKPTKAQRVARRNMQKASRKANRPKKK